MSLGGLLVFALLELSLHWEPFKDKFVDDSVDLVVVLRGDERLVHLLIGRLFSWVLCFYCFEQRIKHGFAAPLAQLFFGFFLLALELLDSFAQHGQRQQLGVVVRHEGGVDAALDETSADAVGEVLIVLEDRREIVQNRKFLSFEFAELCRGLLDFLFFVFVCFYDRKKFGEVLLQLELLRQRLIASGDHFGQQVLIKVVLTVEKQVAQGKHHEEHFGTVCEAHKDVRDDWIVSDHSALNVGCAERK